MANQINFLSVPNNNRTPFVFIEFNNANAVQSISQPFNALMLGQMTSAATATAATPVSVSSYAQAQSLFGQNSMLANMCRVWFQNNTTIPLTVIPLADNGAGTTSTATITFTGPATAAGTLALYIGGIQYPVGITSGETATQIATAVAAAINAVTTCPVTATSSAGVVTLTTVHKGIFNLGSGTGYDLDVRFNYNFGDVTPAGVGFTIAQTSAGTGNPSLSTAIAAMGNTQYNVIVNPYSDATNLGLITTEMTRRFGPTVQAEGLVISCLKGTPGTLETFGATVNNNCLSVIGANAMPSPSYEFAAGVAGVVAFYANIDPARPFQTLSVAGVYPPAFANQFVQSDRNTLLHSGISTFTVQQGNVVAIERLITTYQYNGAGAPDPSYLDATTIFTLSYLRYSTRVMIQTKYPRSKLAQDGIIYSPGQAVVTPKLMAAELVNLCNQWASMGLVQNVAAFQAGLVVELNATDVNRLDILMTPTLMNQFIVAGVQIAFIL